MADYPIVKIPQRFLRINQAVPPLPPPPVLPLEPTEPEAPKQPSTEEISALASGCIGLPMFLFGMFFIYVGSRGSNGSLSTTLGTLCIIGSVIFWLKSYSSDSKNAAIKNREKQDAYEKAKKKYSEDELIYESEIKNYMTSINKYKSDKITYDLIIMKLYKSNEYKAKRTNLRYTLIEKAFREAATPTTYRGRLYKTGVTEEWFFNKLTDFFDKSDISVLRNCIVSDSQFERPYMPDFILSIISINQNIALEIDEPYVGKDGTPIHYMDSNDNYRDKYFLANGWVVIRFTEEQVVKQPNVCISWIIETMNEFVKSKEVNSFRFLKLLKGPSQDNKFIKDSKIELVKIPQWTKEQAHKMAFARYRNTYLPSHLAAKIKEEEYSPLKSVNIEIRTAFNSEDFDKREAIQRLIDEEEGNNHLPF